MKTAIASPVRHALLLAAGLGLAFAIGPASAQIYPAKTITLYVGFP